MATVGYGDYVPVTANGRIVAVGLMVVGISLLGLVGASVASAVVTRIGGRAQEGQSEVKKDLEALRTEIAALRQALLDAGVSGTTQPSPTDASWDGCLPDRHARRAAVAGLAVASIGCPV